MLEVLEIKADNNTVRIVELENRKISITDDIAQLKLDTTQLKQDSALFMTIKDHIDYDATRESLNVNSTIIELNADTLISLTADTVRVSNLQSPSGVPYASTLAPTFVGESSFDYLSFTKDFGNASVNSICGSLDNNINDETLPTTLKVNNMINASKFDPNNSTLTGTTNVNQISVGGFSPNSYLININGLNNIPALNFKGQSTNITGVTYSFGSIINDNTIPTTQKVQNMIDAVPVFNTNNSTLTGTTTVHTLKISSGGTMTDIILSTQNIYNDTTVPTSLKVKNMVDAIPVFNTNNSTLTGLTTINKLRLTTSVLVTNIVGSADEIYNDGSLITSLKVKDMVDAVPVFNTNNSTLTGTTTVDYLKITDSFYLSAANGIYDVPFLKFKGFTPSIKGILYYNSTPFYTDEYLITSAMVKKMIDAVPVFNAYNTTLTGTTTVDLIKFGQTSLSDSGLFNVNVIRFSGQNFDVGYFYSSTDNFPIDDETVPTTLKVKKMIDAIPTFNPNNLSLTGTTTLNTFKFATGASISGIIDSTQNIYNDTTVPTSLKVKNMIDAAPIFNPNNTNLTGQATINSALFGGRVVIGSTGIYSLPGIRFYGQTNWINTFEASGSTTINNSSVPSTARVNELINAVKNNTTLTGTTIVNQLNCNNISTTSHLVVSAEDGIEILGNNDILLQADKVRVSNLQSPAGIPYAQILSPTFKGEASFDYLSFTKDFGNASVNSICGSLDNNINDETLPTTLKMNNMIQSDIQTAINNAFNLHHPIGSYIKLSPTTYISNYPGSWTRTGIWGSRTPMTFYGITVRVIYLGNVARITFSPTDSSTADSRTIRYDALGVPTPVVFYSDDCEQTLNNVNRYTFHDNQTELEMLGVSFTILRNSRRSWSMALSFSTTSNFSYPAEAQYEYRRTV